MPPRFGSCAVVCVLARAIDANSARAALSLRCLVMVMTIPLGCVKKRGMKRSELSGGSVNSRAT